MLSLQILLHIFYSVGLHGDYKYHYSPWDGKLVPLNTSDYIGEILNVIDNKTENYTKFIDLHV